MVTAVVLVASIAHPAGAYPRPGTTEEYAPSTTQYDQVSVTPDGRFIAFASEASDLVPGDTNECVDVFVHDREAGVTERVSVRSDGGEASCGAANAFPGFSPVITAAPRISADGRLVVFHASHVDLVPGHEPQSCGITFSTCPEVYVHDRATGTTEKLWVDADRPDNTVGTSKPSISADGRVVAFVAQLEERDLQVTRWTYGLYVHDLETGVSERIIPGGSEVPRMVLGRDAPALSGDGRWVAFTGSLSTDAVLGGAPTGVVDQVYLHDRDTGATRLVSVADDGTPANYNSRMPAISADGRYIAFRSLASNLVPADRNGAPDYFVHDQVTGRTERVSVTSEGGELGSNPYIFEATAISPDGRWVAFTHGAKLAPGAPEDRPTSALFLHDRVTRQTEFVGYGADGSSLGGINGLPALSADGRTLVYRGYVRDLGPEHGVGDVEVTVAEASVQVSGWARFGPSVSTATDDIDAAVAGGELGGEIIGASAVARPEEDDLLLRLDLAELPHLKNPAHFCCEFDVPTAGAGLPGVMYTFEFTLDDAQHQVRVQPRGGSADPMGPTATLYRCDGTCTALSAAVAPTVGTTGTEVSAAVPLSDLGVTADTQVTGLRGFTGLAREGNLGQLFDKVALPDLHLGPPHVTLGLAPTGTDSADVAFTVPATLDEGRFTATIGAGGQAPGEYDLWVRVCAAGHCDHTKESVTLTEG